MDNLSTIEKQLDELAAAGVGSLARYEVLCLRYAMVREGTPFEETSGGSAYLQRRVAEELAKAGYVEEAFRVVDSMQSEDAVGSTCRRIAMRVDAVEPSGAFDRVLHRLWENEQPNSLAAGAILSARSGDQAQSLAFLQRLLATLSVENSQERHPTWWERKLAMLVWRLEWRIGFRRLNNLPPPLSTLYKMYNEHRRQRSSRNTKASRQRFTNEAEWAQFTSALKLLPVNHETQAIAELAMRRYVPNPQSSRAYTVPLELEPYLPRAQRKSDETSPTPYSKRVRAGHAATEKDWQRSRTITGQIENSEERVYTARDLIKIARSQEEDEQLEWLVGQLWESAIAAESGYVKQSAVQQLSDVAEFDLALRVLHTLDKSWWAYGLTAIRLATVMVQAGKREQGEALLEEARQAIPGLPVDRHQQAYRALAEAYAKAKLTQKALDAVAQLDEEKRPPVLAEIAAAVDEVDASSTARDLVTMAHEIYSEENQTPKARASQLHGIFKRLLPLDIEPFTYEVLALLIQALNRTPAFQKHEYRSADVAETLASHGAAKADMGVYYLVHLLRGDALIGSTQTLQGISGTLPLLLALGGPAAMLELVNSSEQ